MEGAAKCRRKAWESRGNEVTQKLRATGMGGLLISQGCMRWELAAVRGRTQAGRGTVLVLRQGAPESAQSQQSGTVTTEAELLDGLQDQAEGAASASSSTTEPAHTVLKDPPAKF